MVCLRHVTDEVGRLREETPSGRSRTEGLRPTASRPHLQQVTGETTGNKTGRTGSARQVAGYEETGRLRERPHTAFIGLGSNLADPVMQVSRALEALDGLAQTRVVRRSSLYRSAPVGYLAQPDFINAVVQLETGLAPRALLDALLALELEQGRTREFCNAPRTLDLDILLYDDLIHHEHGLTIPHPQMHLRAFVLQPLLEIAPDSDIPGVGTAAAAATQCKDQQLERLV